MKIGLDLRMVDGGAGISRYVFELSLQILEQDKTHQYVLFFHTITPELRTAYEKFGHKMVETKIRHYSLAEQIKLPYILGREKLDLVHFPHFNVPVLYFGKFVLTIHDLTHTRFPGKKKSHIFHRFAYNLVLVNAIRRAKKIIAVSQATKNELREFFGTNQDKVAVVYEGINKIYGVMDREEAFAKVTAKFGLTKPFLLYVGVWRRYKNLPALARVYDHLVKKGFDLDLVLVGETDPFYPEIQSQIMSIVNSARVKALGRVSDEELKWLYNSCLTFVLPSLAEGFGLTALEAAACGAPVAASDIPTLREVMGQGAEFFDPNNEENMYDVLSFICDNPKRQEDLANGGLSRSKHFSWKKAGEETLRVYESTN